MADRQMYDCKAAECDIDCVVSSWGPWTPCSAECAGGFKTRTRVIITFPAGTGRACPPDSHSVVCNEAPCTAAQKAAAPASSSHGFVSRLFHPRGRFQSSKGEQAACVLDKTQAFIDLVVDVFKCTTWDGIAGEPCYPHAAEHLAAHVESCCQGREHMVLWRSDAACASATGEFVGLLRRVFLPNFKGCVQGAPGACAAIKSAAGQVTVASILKTGLAAAQTMYTGGHKHDITRAAHAWLQICGILRDKDLTNHFAPTDCVKAVSSYLQQWGVRGEPLEDEGKRR